MANGNWYERNKVTLAKDLVADGTSEVDTAVIDMSGFDELTFIVDLGDVDAAAVMTFALKENTASSTSSPTPTALAMTSVSAGTLTSGNLVVTEASGNIDDKYFIITTRKFTKRYVYLAITATVESFEIDSIICIQSKAHNLPVTQSSDVFAIARDAH